MYIRVYRLKVLRGLSCSRCFYKRNILNPKKNCCATKKKLNKSLMIIQNVYH